MKAVILTPSMPLVIRAVCVNHLSDYDDDMEINLIIYHFRGEYATRLEGDFI